MPRIKLVTNVSEYALLRGLARTRARLVVSTLLATAAMVGFGLWSAHYVLEVSSSVGVNLGLITFNMMVMLVAAYLQTVLIGDIVFSGPWREQVILGEQPEDARLRAEPQR
jgi:NO-binding membrane sensor protein with MHYT domain